MTMSRMIAALLAGMLFGFGLALGGMLDPSVVRGFLDFSGDFDLRLGFVFAGAVLVSAAGVALSKRRARPAFADRLSLPSAQRIDAPLVAGSALFGIGWGMVGLCPGPAISGVVLGVPSILTFTIAMAGGIAAHEILHRGTGNLARA
jgi:uncharacterized membrane protein YedE/YeeE